MTIKKLAVVALPALLTLAGCKPDPTITRLPLPGGSKFPIAEAVTVPEGNKIIYVSGIGADALKEPGADGKPTYGDTETQTRNALGKIQATLGDLGLTMSDVVQVHVFLVADPATGKMDFSGMMKAWTEYFGTEKQPNLPARTAMQIAGLANPGWLVEIEVIAAHK